MLLFMRMTPSDEPESPGIRGLAGREATQRYKYADERMRELFRTVRVEVNSLAFRTAQAAGSVGKFRSGGRLAPAPCFRQTPRPPRPVVVH